MDFNSVQFNFTPATGDAPTRTHQIAAMQGEKNIGNLSWHPGSGTVNRIWVDEGSRRQGLGLQMMRHVQENHMPTMANGKTMRLQHSPHRDEDGEKFAQATKGEFYAPRRMR